jgi:hypothetical protein
VKGNVISFVILLAFCSSASGEIDHGLAIIGGNYGIGPAYQIDWHFFEIKIGIPLYFYDYYNPKVQFGEDHYWIGGINPEVKVAISPINKEHFHLLLGLKGIERVNYQVDHFIYKNSYMDTTEVQSGWKIWTNGIGPFIEIALYRNNCLEGSIEIGSTILDVENEYYSRIFGELSLTICRLGGKSHKTQ